MSKINGLRFSTSSQNSQRAPILSQRDNAIVVHVTPEAMDGGPLALVRNGDRIRLSAEDKRIDLLVPEAELARRAAEPRPTESHEARGYLRLYRERVLSAARGCDFDFLTHVSLGAERE
jgi:dihydroxy-acid dehydratase